MRHSRGVTALGSWALALVPVVMACASSRTRARSPQSEEAREDTLRVEAPPPEPRVQPPPTAEPADAGPVDPVLWRRLNPPRPQIVTGDPADPIQSAVTKLNEFLVRNLRLHAPVPEGVRRRVTVRLRFDASGAITTAEVVSLSGVRALDDELLTQLRALMERHLRIESLTPEELAALAGRNINVVIPISR